MATTTYLTSREAAERLGVSISTLHLLSQLGEITPAMKAPGLRGAKWFSPDDIDALKSKRAGA
jgi:DNA-binding transcriptional MerR regulator